MQLSATSATAVDGRGTSANDPGSGFETSDEGWLFVLAEDLSVGIESPLMLQT